MTLRLYCDGGCIGANPSTVGTYFSVGRDNEDGTTTLLTFREESRQHFTNNDAELLALARAVEHAGNPTVRKGATRVTIHSDSQWAVKGYNLQQNIYGEKHKAMMEDIWRNVRFLRQSGIDVEVVHVGRQANVQRLGH